MNIIAVFAGAVKHCGATPRRKTDRKDEIFVDSLAFCGILCYNRFSTPRQNHKRRNLMLDVVHLTKIYKAKGGVETKALNDVSVRFPEKGMVFLLGKSGSGKSTLLNVCGGTRFPHVGRNHRKRSFQQKLFAERFRFLPQYFYRVCVSGIQHSQRIHGRR